MVGPSGRTSSPFQGDVPRLRSKPLISSGSRHHAATGAMRNRTARPPFKEALDSSYYLEPIRLKTTYVARYDLEAPSSSQSTKSTVPTTKTNVNVFFIPLIAENGYEALGTVMILVPTTAASGFAGLLRTFAIGSAIAFLAIAWAITFTRDPITSFMVLGLFVIVAIFVAYPLLEAVRLSFLKDGRFSLQTWKMGLSSTYIIALWGSLKLGVSRRPSPPWSVMMAFLVERIVQA